MAFKDEEFIALAFAGAKAGKRVVIVVEKMSELDHILRIAETHEGNMPMVGMRVKLYSKGSGRWENRAVKPPSSASRRRKFSKSSIR